MLATKNRFLMMAGFVLLLGLTATDLFGQSNIRIRQLEEAISSGDVTLTANGNGFSSGAAVVGRLKNNTSNAIYLNAIINNGLYLSNSGRGNNMVAIQVFSPNGDYLENSTDKFIYLLGNDEIQILFYAFSVELELSNPVTADTLRIGSMPSSIQPIASKISRYMADNFDDDPIEAAQLALWRSQRISRTAIARTFKFGDADWEIATRIMNY